MLELILRRDRLLVIGALAAVCAAAWAYTLAGVGLTASAWDMTAMIARMGDMAMAPPSWSPAEILLVVSMWWVMMIAMMLPSAAPTVLLVAAVGRRRMRAEPFAGTGVFVTGYLLVWAGFSLAATLLQWVLSASGLLTAMMTPASALLGGLLLTAAGLYQLTPLKQACLGRCRNPLAFITRYWRPGTAGMLRLGIVHGTYCLGCCWALMALLFVGGVMNLYWIAGIATYVLFEKTILRGRWFSRAARAGLTLWGLTIVLTAMV